MTKNDNTLLHGASTTVWRQAFTTTVSWQSATGNIIIIMCKIC